MTRDVQHRYQVLIGSQKPHEVCNIYDNGFGILALAPVEKCLHIYWKPVFLDYRYGRSDIYGITHPRLYL